MQRNGCTLLECCILWLFFCVWDFFFKHFLYLTGINDATMRLSMSRVLECVHECLESTQLWINVDDKTSGYCTFFFQRRLMWLNGNEWRTNCIERNCKMWSITSVIRIRETGYHFVPEYHFRNIYEGLLFNMITKMSFISMEWINYDVFSDDFVRKICITSFSLRH